MKLIAYANLHHYSDVEENKVTVTEHKFKKDLR